MECSRCKSGNIIKNGFHNRWKQGSKRRIQYFMCNNCGKQFYKRGEYEYAFQTG